MLYITFLWLISFIIGGLYLLIPFYYFTLDHVAVLFLIFSGISIVFSTVVTPVYNSRNRAWGFPFLHILANTFWWQPFCQVWGDCNLHFPDYWWGWASFHVPLDICMSSLEKSLFRSSAHCKIRLLIFWLSMECGSFWARDQTHSKTVVWAAAVTTPDP